MPTITSQSLPQAQVEFRFELALEEFKPYLAKAAIHLSEQGKIPGFRPGNAPYEIVAKHFGEMRIYEAAAEEAIPKLVAEAIREKKIETIGQPAIEVEKLAPGNPFVFKAVVSLVPSVKLAAWSGLKFKRNPKAVGPAEVEKVVEDVRKTRASEAAVDRPAAVSDKIMVDMEIKQEAVPIEGGQTKDHAIYLNEKYYIPGLPEQLIGLKKNEVKDFSLVFPEGHYQKNLAGKKADFKVTVKDVFERNLPVLDDNFAQGLGQKTMADLRQLIESNLKLEAGQKEEQRLEIEILETLVKKSEFGELSEVLINSEKQKMFEELKQSLAQMNISLEDYLKDLKKTEKEVADDFAKGAAERVKSALVIREIAKQEKITCSEEELEKELERVRELHKDNPKIEERLKDPAMRDYVASMLVNRKVVGMLKEKLAL